MRNNYDERKLIIVSTYFLFCFLCLKSSMPPKAVRPVMKTAAGIFLLPVSGEGLLYVTYGTVPDVKVVVVVTVVVVVVVIF